MTIIAADLETKYDGWFIGMKNTKQAKREILELFSTEPDEEHTILGRSRIFTNSRGRSSSNGTSLKFTITELF